MINPHRKYINDINLFNPSFQSYYYTQIKNLSISFIIFKSEKHCLIV